MVCKQKKIVGRVKECGRGYIILNLYAPPQALRPASASYTTPYLPPHVRCLAVHPFALRPLLCVPAPPCACRYVLAFWGLLTTLITAFLEYYREVGFDIPKTPTAVLEAFPLISILRTLVMFPPGINVQLSSVIPRVQISAGLRLAKVRAPAASKQRLPRQPLTSPAVRLPRTLQLRTPLA